VHARERGDRQIKVLLFAETVTVSIRGGLSLGPFGMSLAPLSPTTFQGRKTMFSNLFAAVKPSSPKVPSAPGLAEDESDCLHDATLDSPALTAIWKSSASKVDTSFFYRAESSSIPMNRLC